VPHFLSLLRSPYTDAMQFRFYYALFLLVVGIYFAVSLMMLAKKIKVGSPWLAWVPVINIWYMCVVGGKPGWWYFLCAIPLVGIYFYVEVWRAIAVRAGKPEWVGVLMAMPIVAGIVGMILAPR
jgi:hypothetical protein